MTNKLELSDEELNDIWSALAVWKRHLDKKENPITAKAIDELILKIRKAIKDYK